MNVLNWLVNGRMSVPYVGINGLPEAPPPRVTVIGDLIQEDALADRAAITLINLSGASGTWMAVPWRNFRNSLRGSSFLQSLRDCRRRRLPQEGKVLPRDADVCKGIRYLLKHGFAVMFDGREDHFLPTQKLFLRLQKATLTMR